MPEQSQSSATISTNPYPMVLGFGRALTRHDSIQPPIYYSYVLSRVRDSDCIA